MDISVRNDCLVPDDAIGPIRKHPRRLNLEQLIQINQVGGTDVDFRLRRCDGAYAPGREAYRNQREIT